MAWTFESSSKADADLMRIPDSAPLPVPTITATGVARPKAQGQETTRTETPMLMARGMSCFIKAQHKKTTMAIKMTVGTKMAATLSAKADSLALLFDASSTRWTILLMVVSLPTVVISILKEPDVLRVEPMTSSPSFLKAGTASPVMAASSRWPYPSLIRPSLGTREPGLTMAISPILSEETGTSTSCPSFSMRAVSGARERRFSIDDVVFDLAMASKYFPRLTRTKIIPVASK